MNPTTGHPLDCACCRISITRTPGRKRAREDADLSTFLPEDPPDEEGEEEWGEEEGEGEEELDALINDALLKTFAKHVEDLDAARQRRIEALSFKSALEDDGQEEVNQDANQDEIDGLGVWLPGDEFQGDVNYRTLQKLLTRVDQRGFERSAQQLEFHVAFMKAAARVIYRGSWETERPAIMKKFGWEKSNSEVLISTPRRFGVRAHALQHHWHAPHARGAVCPAENLQHRHFLRVPCACIWPRDSRLLSSPSRVAQAARADRRVSTAAQPAPVQQPARIANLAPGRFVRLAGGDKRICEYNQARRAARRAFRTL